MKRLLGYLILVFCLSPVLATAQYNFNIGGLQYSSGPSVPGSCTRDGSKFFKNTTTKAWYTCIAGSWAIDGGGGGGAGTVTGVLGTANQINSDGSTSTPTLTLSSTLIIPGTITSATYATSGSNGGLSGIEGTGAGLTPATGSDLLYPDSTNHCWHQSLNNVDVGCTASASNTLTMSNKTLTTPTIASHTNAQHDHTNAAGGGLLTGAALTPSTTAGLWFPNYPGKLLVTVASLVLTTNEVDCYRWMAPNSITATRFTYQPTISAGAASHVGFAIYNSTGTTRIATTGALDGTLTGAQTATSSSFTLNAGTDYLMCWTNDAATSTTWSIEGNEATGAFISNFTNPSGGIVSLLKGTTASAAGVPPASLSTLISRTTGNGNPYIFISP